ncbi:MAG TPA: TonB-dependent receptor [Candidatus Eisenbacteria bacterium]|nr:TonB-dependent receptor [Candidatus Eisenbacteria bacterium]
MLRIIPARAAVGAAALSLLAAVLAAPAGAQTAPDSARSAFADTTRPVTFLREVVITGSRYPRAYYESPQALSFLTRTQMREQVPTVVGDVLQTLPGVDMSKDSPWEQRPALRGLGGQRVLVLMDGSPINSARGNGPHPSLVDPGQIERVEVVRGPSSVAYGSDALGGAINIITRDALLPEGDNFRGSAVLGVSSVDRQRNGYLELMPRLGKLTAFISSGGRRALNYALPDVQGIERKVANSGFKDYNALANLRYPLTPHIALKGGYQIYRGSSIGLPGLTAEIPFLFSQEFSFPNYDRDAAWLTMEHSYPQSWLAKTHAKVYWQRENRDFFSHVEEHVSFVPPGPPLPPGATYRISNQDRFFDLKTWGFQTQFTSRKTARYLASAGIDLATDRTDGDNVRNRYWTDAYGTTVQTDPVAVTASVPDGSFGSYAAFVQSEWYLAPKWTASAGGRYTRYRYHTELGPRTATANFPALSVNDGALCGSLGIVYAALRDLHVTANVANGYRHPNAQDLFFNGPASVGTVLGNAALTPEKSRSYDLGLRWGPGSLAVAGNAFYSTYEDLIDALDVTPSTNPPGAPHTFQYTNISGARIWGGEVEGEVRFLRNYRARVAMAGAVGDITNADAILKLYGVVQEQAPLPNVSPFKGTAALRWTTASGRFWVEPAARWSWRTNRLPLAQSGVPQFSEFKKEWMVGDIYSGALLPRGQKVVVGVRNLANRSYRLPLGSIDEPARSWVGSLMVDF